MKAVLINYNFEPSWLKDYPDLEVTLYDRSDDDLERGLTDYGQVFRTPNVGDVDYDKLGYLVEHYDHLPDVFLWGKSNLFKFVEEPTFQKALENNVFMPLLKFDHRIYGDQFGQVNFYRGDMYYERNDNWFLNTLGSNYFKTFDDWAKHFGLPSPAYIPFAPGGNYLLTREKVHKYSRDFYEDMRSFLPYAQRPAEAHCAERSYYLMWK